MSLPLYQLGRVPWEHSQLAYHALARLGREGLILCKPDRPYLCLGYHQDARQELDLAWLEEAGLPWFRREVGGGAVLLDGDQVFWQLVLRRDHPLVTLNRSAFFRRFLRPVTAACRTLGMAAELVPPNDVAVGGARICGTGAGEIGDCVVLVGNLLRGFDPVTMAWSLAAPDPVFRQWCRIAMQNGITSLRRELGPEVAGGVSDRRLWELLARGFASEVGGLVEGNLDSALEDEMAIQARRMLSADWRFFPRRPAPRRRVKIRAGLHVAHYSQKTPAGRICAVCLLKNGRVERGEVYGPTALGESRQALNAGLPGLVEDAVPAALLRGAALLNGPAPMSGRTAPVEPGEHACDLA